MTTASLFPVEADAGATFGGPGAVASADIQGWPGYRVLYDGHVESCRTFHGELGYTWHRLRPRPDKDGYLSVTLQNRGIRKTCKVSHLVLLAFVGPRPDGYVACHYPDPDPTNNSASNLRWDTQQGNIDDRTECGSGVKGAGHPMAKLTDEQVAEIRRRFARMGWHTNARALALEFGVTASHVGSLARGKYRRAAKSGEPGHPLYIRADAPLKEFT